jgi:hypothetical protein
MNRRDYWTVEWGLEMIIDAKRLLKGSLQEVIGMARYVYLAMVKDKHLGDDAAGSAAATAAIGLDGSGGRGLNIWSVGGDGEESSEEIH